MMTEAAARTDLSDLVRRRRAELGLALRTLADRCIDPDTGLVEWKYGTLDRLEKGLAITPPILPQLRALAEGLQVVLGVVQDAAGAQYFGIDTQRGTSPEARALMLNLEQLTPADRAKVADLIETWAAPPKRTS